MINYHKLRGLKQNPIISPSSLAEKSGQARLGSLLSLSQMQIKELAQRDSYLGGWGRETFPGSLRWWLNSVPCSHRTKVPLSLLDVGQGFLFAPGVPSLALWSLHMAPVLKY